MQLQEISQDQVMPAFDYSLLTLPYHPILCIYNQTAHEAGTPICQRAYPTKSKEYLAMDDEKIEYNFCIKSNDSA